MSNISRRACLRKISFAVGAAMMPAFTAFGEPVKPVASELAAMDDIAGKMMDQYQIPGLSVAIARQGQFVYQKGFGLADKDSGEKVTTSHLFRIASVSKPVTSVAVFTLIEKGLLKLDDIVFGEKGVLGTDFGKHLPGAVEKITVRHLLTHTCGGWRNDGEDPMFRKQGMSAKELIAWTLREQSLKNEPGKSYAYSNFGYCILGRIIEKLTGGTYEEYVQKSILAKCGVTAMRLGGNTLQQKAKNEVIYYARNGENAYKMNVTRMDAHGGWIGSPSDLVRFAMHVDGFSTTPQILGAQSIKTMTTPTEVNATYACGWAVNRVPNWWHGGSLPGTSTILVRTASGLCWAAFVNTRANADIDGFMWKMVKAVPAWKA